MKLNTEMSTIMKDPAIHNHEDDEEKIKAEKNRQKHTKPLRNVYNEEVERTTNSIFPEYRNVKSSLYRTSSRQLPPDPRRSRPLHIRGPWKKLGWRKISVEKRSRKWDCYGTVPLVWSAQWKEYLHLPEKFSA